MAAKGLTDRDRDTLRLLRQEVARELKAGPSYPPPGLLARVLVLLEGRLPKGDARG